MSVFFNLLIIFLSFGVLVYSVNKPDSKLAIPFTIVVLLMMFTIGYHLIFVI